MDEFLVEMSKRGSKDEVFNVSCELTLDSVYTFYLFQRIPLIASSIGYKATLPMFGLYEFLVRPLGLLNSQHGWAGHTRAMAITSVPGGYYNPITP